MEHRSFRFRTEGLVFLKTRKPIGTLSLLFRYGRNSGDSTVQFGGQTFLPGQANDFYIFPAVGMAIFAAQSSRVTDEMFIEAARAVADQVSPELLKRGLLYPLQSNILGIEAAARVAKLVFDSGLARVARPTDMVAFIRGHVYNPMRQLDKGHRESVT